MTVSDPHDPLLAAALDVVRCIPDIRDALVAIGSHKD